MMHLGRASRVLRQPGDYRNARFGLDGDRRRRGAFTLIELLVVISIITMLISILMPSLSQARNQAKRVHCLARLKEFGNALAAYETLANGSLPPAEWTPTFEPAPGDTHGSPHTEVVVEQPVNYGWAEILFSYVYHQEVETRDSFPVQRNLDSRLFEKYLVCQAVGDDGASSGHFRVYLPAWGAGASGLDRRARWTEDTHASATRSAQRETIRPKLPLIGDANEFSERGDGHGDDDCSYIDAGEANFAGTDGQRNGNRFSDRHSGGANYLFQDLHGAWDVQLRQELARDFDLNGVVDIDAQP